MTTAIIIILSVLLFGSLLLHNQPVYIVTLETQDEAPRVHRVFRSRERANAYVEKVAYPQSPFPVGQYEVYRIEEWRVN